MKIVLSSVLVDDQEKALKFYTEVLGFIKKEDIPMGGPRWLTVVPPDEQDGTQLVLEPDFNPMLAGAEKIFKKALFEKGIPWTSFAVDDVEKEYKRLEKRGVNFKTKPTKMGACNHCRI